MNNKIKVLTFDTGGTVLDWHSGFRDALKYTGEKYGIEKNWASVANKLRKKSMDAMLQLGENSPPTYNFDDAHRFCLEEVLADEDITEFSIIGLDSSIDTPPPSPLTVLLLIETFEIVGFEL